MFTAYYAVTRLLQKRMRNGLDPLEVLESLPVKIKEAFETQNTPLLQQGFAELSPDVRQSKVGDCSHFHVHCIWFVVTEAHGPSCSARRPRIFAISHILFIRLSFMLGLQVPLQARC